MSRKNTLQKEIQLSGIGIHTGKEVELRLKPSSSGKISFRRTDLSGLEVSLDPRVVKAKNSIYIEAKGCKIQTLEHLLAVLYVFGIDSLVVEMDNDEIPIMDGSAAPFVEAILEAGVRHLPERKEFIQILKPFSLHEGDASLSFYPDSGFKITYCIEYDHPLIQKQELSLDVNVESFVSEIAPSRTFGFLKDVPALRAQDLALGGSLDNAVVLDEKGLLNGTLRFPDEFVRHKILDLIGDLSLMGSPLIGHFKAQRAGHNLHLKAVHFLLDNPEYIGTESKL
ncbi:MAG: UDP-3-O-[3-hydroxymyristoyl] N-acetylglucosamine deacetylase [Candidatus Aminicenantes bacterium]|nr:MAG: UDP-3-O-[3-hydroxymyristoyl] N-acetylglucosamine deacetylase [Candidatus Aminicenantes bacterium]